MRRNFNPEKSKAIIRWINREGKSRHIMADEWDGFVEEDEDDEEDFEGGFQQPDPPERCLIVAATVGNVEQAELLLERNSDLDIEARDEWGFSALDSGCLFGHKEVVKLLLDSKANVEAVHDKGWTPVIWASTNGRLEVVELLHARGANILHVDEIGHNALHEAALYDHLPVCEFLLSKGMDLMVASNSGQTALDLYGSAANPALAPETKALRIAALRATREAYWRQEVKIRLENASASLLFSDAFSDLVFVCPGGERIHAHRNIVSANSPHARALLQGPWAENADERVAVVQMPQSAAAVRALLRFLYTGEADASAVEASMSDVLELASQHEQLALKAACECNTIAALSVPTVVPSLMNAHPHELAALNAACVALLKAREAYWRKTVMTRLENASASLLFSDAFSDLVFVCPGGERIHAHRNIVSASSPHARALLQGPWAENADERVAVVQMPQSAAAVRALLRFLYTGEADASAVEASMSDVLDLASQHEQPALTAACERLTIAALSLSTVVPAFLTACFYELAALKAACLDLMTSGLLNSMHVLKSEALAGLETTHPLLWRELVAELKAACERNTIPPLSERAVLPTLMFAHHHDLVSLKAACVRFIKANSIDVTLSTTMKSTHPLLWRDFRAAMGLLEEEEQEQEVEQQEELEGHVRKCPREGN